MEAYSEGVHGLHDIHQACDYRLYTEKKFSESDWNQINVLVAL